MGGRGSLETPGIPPSQARNLWDERFRQHYFQRSSSSIEHNGRIAFKGLKREGRRFVDNKVLLASWRISEIFKKKMFFFTMARNISFTLFYIPSKDNLADAPSRVLSDMYCSLSDAAWTIVDGIFWPHSIDLRALPSNARVDSSGRLLRFYCPFPCPQSSGCNVFSQKIHPE